MKSRQEQQVEKLIAEIESEFRENRRRARVWAKETSPRTAAEGQRQVSTASQQEAVRLLKEFQATVEVVVTHLATSLGRNPGDVRRMLRAELDQRIRPGDARANLESALEQAKAAVAEKIWKRIA